MHIPHSPSTPASVDKSGVVNTTGQQPDFKAMLRVLTGPDGLRKDIATDRNLFSPSYLPVPPNSCDAISNMSFDSPVSPYQRPGATGKYQQFGIRDHMGTDQRCSMTSNGLPNGDVLGQGFQNSKEQYNHWHVNFPPVDSATSDLFNSWSRSTSQNSHHWRPHALDQTSSQSQFTADDGSNVGSVPSPDLIHPVPRQSPYAVTNYFSPGKLPESVSSFGSSGALPEDWISDDRRCVISDSDWTNDGSVYSCLIPGKQSPGTSSVATSAEKYTPATTDHSLSPWPSMRAQLPWDSQRPMTTQCNKDENTWANAAIYSNVDQQSGHFDQYSASSDSINGLPGLAQSVETYVQPSSLLEPHGPTCNLYTHGTTNTQPEHNPAQRPLPSFAYQNAVKPNDSVESFFTTSGHTSFPPNHVGRLSPWSSDARNALLIEYKRRGLSYKEIKRIGGFKEAESTLRGRFRTLTKAKEQRVRKPHWHERDVSPWL